MSLKNLNPYAKNPRIHGDGRGLKKSIVDLGDISGVVFNIRNQQLVGGHYRIKSIPSESIIEKCPVFDTAGTVAEGVIILPTGQRLNYREVDWDETKHKLACIEANNQKIQGTWEQELLETILGELNEDLPEGDFQDFGLDLLANDFDFNFDSTDEPLTDDDVLPEEPQRIVIEKGDLIELGNHRLLCGDSTDKEQVAYLMGGEKADMVFTDPPYGVSYAAKNEFLNNQDKGNRIQTEIKNDHMSPEETGELWSKVFQAWAPFHEKYSSFYICSPQGGDLFLMMMMMMNKNRHPLKHTIIWAKNNHVLGRSDYNYKHEPILYGWQYKHKFYGYGDQKFSVWNYDKPLKNDLHPTMKPVELVVNAILNSTERNMRVADYFLGSGTTLIACEKTSRKCFGMEVDEKYCQVIVQRWCDYTGKDEVKINGSPVFWSAYKMGW